MAGIPREFAGEAPGAVASYDYFDIARGIGYEFYYLASTIDAKILTTTNFYSVDILSAATHDYTTGDYVKVIEKDFDLSFIYPRTIGGLTRVTIPFKVHGVSTNKEYSGKITARVKKNSTELVSNTGHVITIVTTGTTNKAIFDVSTIDLDIPSTHFKAGDIFRLTIELWGKEHTTSSQGIYMFGHDPKDRSQSYLSTSGGKYFNFSGANEFTTVSSIDIPFKLDL